MKISLKLVLVITGLNIILSDYTEQIQADTFDLIFYE